MFKRILLAYDGSLEGAVALREGALLAKRCGAKVFILSVVPETASVRTVEGIHGGVVAQQRGSYEALLQRGVERLKQLGFEPVARLVAGEPAREIGRFAKEVHADLVVVGHRKRTILERWWSGPGGSYISDYLKCSLLIARTAVSDEAIEAEIRTGASAG
ncbi:MAG TPA: universal stress protein [Caulobacteraceae bacterium]